MCGINGFNWSNKKLVNIMNTAINHRGPDDTGNYTDKNISLGHVRLSILDLSEAGHQPMFYSKETGACSEKYNKKNIKKCEINIVFNGEIYNFLEIKEELLKKGYCFLTGTDTEIILASYLEWGFDCVKKFNGMWAFAIYDLEKNLIFLSRDRLGQKPLYYFFDKRKFIFSSEMKGILEHEELKLNTIKNINKDAIDFYFSIGYIPAPLSIYKDIYKLKARQNLIFELENQKIKKWNYYEIPEYKPIYNKKKLIEEGRTLLNDAVRLRLIADVPIGAFLSGGLDSSSVVGEMSKFTDLKNLHTFSIGFEGKWDETNYVNIVKNYFKTIHHHHFFTEEDFEKNIENYSKIYDEPFGDYSGFPTYKVSEMAKKFVTISLSGDGGDEIFGGYNIHQIGKRMDFMKKMPRFIRKIGAKLPAKKNLKKSSSLYLLKKAFEVSLNKPEEFYSKAIEDEYYRPKIYKDWTTKKLKYCLKKGDNKMMEGFRIFDLLFNSLGDNFLVKVDRASMANALEVRSPFLDYRFIEFSQKIPTKLKVDLFKTKKLMREIIKDIVPSSITKRGKQGFTPPLEKWILNTKYLKIQEKHLQYLKKINETIYLFYKEKKFDKNNKVYINLWIRLFLFGKWFEQWIKK